MGGYKAPYECIKAFSETDFTEDLKKIDSRRSDARRCRPGRANRRLGPAVDQAAAGRDPQGVPGLPTRHVHHPCRRHQPRPARVHPGLHRGTDEKQAPVWVPEPSLPDPLELLAGNGAPETISGWQAVADGLLSDECCAFHRNVGISGRDAWIYQHLPVCLKWAGMAAIASHHVRLVLFPSRLDTDRTGFVDIPRSLGRRKLLTQDVNTIRETNNAIFNDIFWVTSLRRCRRAGLSICVLSLGPEPGYAAVLSGFEAIDRGRHVLEDTSASPGARQSAEDDVWEGNLRTPRARAARSGAATLRSPLVHVRETCLDRLGHELRGTWGAA